MYIICTYMCICLHTFLYTNAMIYSLYTCLDSLLSEELSDRIINEGSASLHYCRHNQPGGHLLESCAVRF